MPDGDSRRVAGGIPEIPELRHVALGGIVERQLPLVSELQDGHRGEALGHRRDPEDRVGVDRRVRYDIAHARRSGMGQLTVDDNAPRGAGHVRGPGEVGEQAIDVGEGAFELRAPVGDRIFERRRRLRGRSRRSNEEGQDGARCAWVRSYPFRRQRSQTVPGPRDGGGGSRYRISKTEQRSNEGNGKDNCVFRISVAPFLRSGTP